MTAGDTESVQRLGGRGVPLEDPYQHGFGPYDHLDWFRHQNEMVRAREWCLVCRRATPEHEDVYRKFIAAGGCIEGPFCSENCFWRWMIGEGRDE